MSSWGPISFSSFSDKMLRGNVATDIEPSVFPLTKIGLISQKVSVCIWYICINSFGRVKFWPNHRSREISN